MLKYMCVLLRSILPQLSSTPVLKAGDVAVGLQAGEEDVEEPQAQEQQGGEDAGDPRAAELSADGGPASEQQHGHADESEDGEECDGEGQRARVHLELLSFNSPVDGGHRPRHADPQEHVHGVAAGHVTNGRIGMLVLHGGDFTGKSVWDETKREREREREKTSESSSHNQRKLHSRGQIQSSIGRIQSQTWADETKHLGTTSCQEAGASLQSDC